MGSTTDDARRKRIREELAGQSDERLCAMSSELHRDGWEPEVLEVAAELLAERGIRPRVLDGCALCGGELERGTVSVHGTLLGFLFVGFSHQQCWFRSAETGKEQVVVAPGGSLPAQRCKGCGSLLVAPRP